MTFEPANILTVAKAAKASVQNNFFIMVCVLIVDDLLATGGTVNAVAKLVEKNGGEITAMEFLIELTELGGRDVNKNYYINTLVQYDI